MLYVLLQRFVRTYWLSVDDLVLAFVIDGAFQKGGQKDRSGARMIDKGYFLITDITGYTTFLTQSELDHAEHIIEALFESQLASIKPPLVVSNFQGDAILCYVPADALDSGRVMFDQVSDIYRAFADKMAEMLIDPPCSCNACSQISTLDLKIFLHYGEYLVKKMGEREEILGSDVILAHRMMKNDVKEKTGLDSYLLMTEAAFQEIGIEDPGIELIDHSQSYEHVGEVKMLVSPLQ